MGGPGGVGGDLEGGLQGQGAGPCAAAPQRRRQARGRQICDSRRQLRGDQRTRTHLIAGGGPGQLQVVHRDDGVRAITACERLLTALVWTPVLHPAPQALGVHLMRSGGMHGDGELRGSAMCQRQFRLFSNLPQKGTKLYNILYLIVV